MVDFWFLTSTFLINFLLLLFFVCPFDNLTKTLILFYAVNLCGKSLKKVFTSLVHFKAHHNADLHKNGAKSNLDTLFQN